MRPLIGIACHADFRQESGRPIYCNNRAYSHAVEQAGGIPVLIPFLEDVTALENLLVRLDGVLLSGGVDIAPERYHEEPHPMLRRTSDELDGFEFTLAHWALREDMPVLGVCRGMQLLNVVLGGTLYQDLGALYSSSIDHCHQELPRNTISHDVFVDAGSRMEKLLGTRQFGVNSLHHQAIKIPGQGVRITGRAEDGVPELMEVPAYRFVMAIQSHPEEIYMKESACANLFSAFVHACSKTSFIEEEEQVEEALKMSA
ncbi:MAG TPA: gamma-glutamyl-gamma-aminobutyrate hydrolase family protein [Ktedonobacteraceae bacterium]|nr:gamma-glutamyl-gamma-aminobutyrate hydrolase family protein [Ktedonobacteraceae bacterium]